ncbi:MAG: hypothetical protein ACREQN_15125 [Candidatus Binataceae bacterium]
MSKQIREPRRVRTRRRIHREDPARSLPIRGFSKLYRTGDCADDETPIRPSGSDDAGDPRMPDSSVGLAYRVIEKHINEGRHAAEQINREQYNTRAESDSIRDLTDRMLRYQSELLPLWLQMLTNILTADPAQFNLARTAPASPNGMGTNGPHVVSIEVDCRRPVEVSLDLGPNMPQEPPNMIALRTADPAKPALRDVRFVPGQGNGGIKLRIRVPEGQSPGTYSGAVVSRVSGESIGTLVVRIAE